MCDVLRQISYAPDAAAAAGLQIDSSTELNCPISVRLAARLQGLVPNLEALLFHALEWADAAGGKHLEVILDERSHPTRSLLQPGLADFQGPGILIVVHGQRLRHCALSVSRAPGSSTLKQRQLKPTCIPL